MEAISNSENSPILRAYSKAGSTAKQPEPGSSEVAATKVQLTDVNSLANKVSRTGDDIRPDAVERGRALLADPNWPNDTVLEGLADKLLSSEDFNA
jgi:2,4-dienoyl-CoA reductase-like NADH-dependent reductase (Old Yellow Enzyme family)